MLPIDRSLLRATALLLPALLVLLAAGCRYETSAKETTLRFSAIPDSNTTELAEKFDRVAAHLSGVLGVDVEYVPSASYAASVEAFKNGDIQLAWFGGLTGAQARNAVDGARAIAQGDLDPHFKSYFIAHKDTGIGKSSDFPLVLKGRTFTFGSDDSTSGRLMPEHFIRQATGQSPEEFFGHPNAFSGAHDRTAKLVEAGTYEAGAMNYKRYDSMVAEGKLDPDVCRIVWVTPDYVDYNWTAHPVLEEMFGADFIQRLQGALVGMTDKELLSAMQRNGLIEASNEDFQSIHELAVELDFLR